ncbi:MAG TPA: pyroglutamyl-peptidase I [Rudaea sp.]|jgi:pyroglutamyl-peptidase
MTARAPVLLTGFEAFADETENPSLLIARTLDGELIAGRRVVGAALPTEFARALVELEALIDAHRPALVLAVGQAGGRAEISLERVAINLIDARIKDNAGGQPVDVPVIDGAPNAYFSTLPLKAMLKRLHEAQIPAALSHTAGTFVCNQVFFGLAHRLATKQRRLRGGFVHVPYLPEQAARHPGTPSLSLTTMIEAIRLCLQTALTTRSDLHFAAGATH